MLSFVPCCAPAGNTYAIFGAADSCADAKIGNKSEQQDMIANIIALAPSGISYIILGKDLNLIESIQSPIFWGAIVVDCIMVAIMTVYFKHKKKKEETRKGETE